METVAIPLVLAYGPLVLMGAVWLAAGLLRLMDCPTAARRKAFQGEQPNSHHP